ncbi:hypothetical protein KCP76_19450 [Salmonella enterica subsp. enterica serovar Weltevreden]|nr:hypothetical protein KCP76_19450 [Salmonella enterica subsp. enterica serovar Weltevreden]
MAKWDEDFVHIHILQPSVFRLFIGNDRIDFVEPKVYVIISQPPTRRTGEPNGQPIKIKSVTITTQMSIGEHFGISSQAVGKWLRKGKCNSSPSHPAVIEILNGSHSSMRLTQQHTQTQPMA